MSEEEGRFFPDFSDQLVKVVRRRRTVASLDLHRVGDIVQQAVLGVVEQLALLTFLDRFDGSITRHEKFLVVYMVTEL